MNPASLIKRLINAGNLIGGWQRVRDNNGCAGSDGISIRVFENVLQRNLSLLTEEISHQTYHPLPLLKILVDKGKGNGESRVLSIPTVRDRVAQASTLNILEPIFEAELSVIAESLRSQIEHQAVRQENLFT
jgi:retron-type reverse transcriptase